jgi:hypothetical protein
MLNTAGNTTNTTNKNTATTPLRTCIPRPNRDGTAGEPDDDDEEDEVSMLLIAA